MSKRAEAKHLILGTRGSELALFQARAVAAALEQSHEGLKVEIQTITTSGDKILDSPLAKIGDKGLFVKEIESALLAGEIDLAVHSSKDLPTELPQGLTLAAFSSREDPRDTFIGKIKSLEQLPQGAKIGTSSLRRRSQLLSLRPDLDIVDIRGNVQTRIRKIEELGLDGTILAAAGIKRLERESEASFYFGIDQMIPAVGQGVIAVETREDDALVRQLLASQNHEDAAAAVRAERALMHWLEGGCQVPIGAHATIDAGTLTMHAYLGSLDGSEFVRDSISGPVEQAEELGVSLAKTIFAAGGEAILAAVRSTQIDEDGRWSVDKPVNHP